jgi:hypothetical protein
MMALSVVCAHTPPNPVNSPMPIAACWARGGAWVRPPGLGRPGLRDV